VRLQLVPLARGLGRSTNRVGEQTMLCLLSSFLPTGFCFPCRLATCQFCLFRPPRTLLRLRCLTRRLCFVSHLLLRRRRRRGFPFAHLLPTLDIFCPFPAILTHPPRRWRRLGLRLRRSRTMDERARVKVLHDRDGGELLLVRVRCLLFQTGVVRRC
jgi:hypothetical protein